MAISTSPGDDLGKALGSAETLARLLHLRLASRMQLAAESNDLKAAAVLVPIVDRASGPSLIFTRRTSNMGNYKGHVAFPGGRRDPDEDLSDTAIRETEEEIGIPRQTVEIVGRLDDVHSNLGYAISPFVGHIIEEPQYVLSAFEVAEVFEVPVLQLMDPAIRGTSLFNIRGNIVPTYAFRAGNNVIWGVTGRIVNSLLEVLRGE